MIHQKTDVVNEGGISDQRPVPTPGKEEHSTDRDAAYRRYPEGEIDPIGRKGVPWHTTDTKAARWGEE